MGKYIKPPRSEDCTWRDGPPPEVGWWPARFGNTQNTNHLRHWDGETWSWYADSFATKEQAGKVAEEYRCTPSENELIKWTDRWWLTPQDTAAPSSQIPRLLASYTDDTVSTIDDVYQLPHGRDVEVVRRHGYAQHNGRVALRIKDTGNGLIAHFPPVTSTEQDYFVCLDYSQARDLCIALVGHKALNIKEVG